MAFLSSLRGVNPISTGPEARCVPEEATWGDVIRCFLEEDRIFTVHAVPPREL
jgi:hypothetical protein